MSKLMGHAESDGVAAAGDRNRSARKKRTGANTRLDILNDAGDSIEVALAKQLIV